MLFRLALLDDLLHSLVLESVTLNTKLLLLWKSGTKFCLILLVSLHYIIDAALHTTYLCHQINIPPPPLTDGFHLYLVMVVIVKRRLWSFYVPEFPAHTKNTWFWSLKCILELKKGVFFILNQRWYYMRMTCFLMDEWIFLTFAQNHFNVMDRMLH